VGAKQSFAGKKSFFMVAIQKYRNIFLKRKIKSNFLFEKEDHSGSFCTSYPQLAAFLLRSGVKVI